MTAAPRNRATRGSNGWNRTERKTRLTTEPAKLALIEHVKTGLTIAGALEKIGYAQKTYEEWRRKDKDFAVRVDQARQLRGQREVVQGERLGFAEWRKKYLKVDTPWHQMQWVDMLENRDPRDLHDSQVFEKNRRDRLMFNCPPFHGKSVAITIDYSTYKLCMDPSYRILVISAGSELAKDFLFGIKQRLTSPDFLDMQLAYAPDGGWEATAESWTEGRIVFGADVRAAGSRAFHEKDANVVALGMRSKVYGRRADLVIVDDGVDTTNVSEHGKQMKWLRSMVETRIEAGGKLLVVGTRVAPVDLYSELRNPDNYANGKVPWTYLASPAILQEGATPEEHVTLWPRAQVPWVPKVAAEQGELCLCERPECTEGFQWGGQQMYARWDGLHLELGPRAANSATDWALIFQQSSVSENSTFPEYAVQRTINKLRLCGRLEADRAGHPLGGMHGKYIIAGLDPAIKGHAGIIVGAVDRETQKRHILAAFNMKAPTAEELKNKMYELTEFYGIQEWRVEKTGLLQFFTQDAALRTWFANRGVRFTEHLTGCVPDDVEIMTREGWKRRTDLTIGEDVLTHAGFEPLLALTAMDAPEKVYRADSQNLACAFTPDHRHLVRWTGNSRSEERFVTSDDLKTNTAIRLTIDPVVDRLPDHGEDIDLAAILGWYMTEGSERKNGGIYIHQSRQANPDKYAEIQFHLDNLGWDYSIHNNGLGVDSFYVKASFAPILRDLAPGKNPDPLWVAAMTPNEREWFMRAALLGDGHGETFFSTDLPKVEVFEMAAVLNGFAVRRFEHENGNGIFNKNKTCWGVRRKVKKYAHISRIDWSLIDGEGQMWCPTTASGTWVARSEGRSFVTGNSNKWDAGFGVSSMSSLFGEYDKAWDDPDGGWREITPPLIELPRPNQEGMKTLIHQLITWTPELDPGKVPCDLVMALWFFNTGAREYLGVGRSGNVVAFGRSNKFTAPNRQKTYRVSFADYRPNTL